MPSWERPEHPGRFSVEATARRVGHYKWIEQRLFELIGGWVATVPEVETKRALGAHCYHHAFHADLWHQRLPNMREMSATSLTRPASPEVAIFFDAVADAEHSIEKLAGMYRVVLPALIAAQTFHLYNTATVSDAPTIRALELCLRDNMEDWREGEMMVQSLIATPEDVDRAAERHKSLTNLLLVSGGLVGENSTRFSDESSALGPESFK